jgi:hypothetical protein
MKKIVAITVNHGFEGGCSASQVRRNPKGFSDLQLKQAAEGIERLKTLSLLGVVTLAKAKCQYIQIEVERER